MQQTKALRARVKVLSIRDHRIPRVKLVELGGDKMSITMDIHSELLVFGMGEELVLVISREHPEYSEGRDFCARGVVVSIKNGERHRRVVISLWGYIAVLDSEDPSILEDLGLRPTDQIYYCLIKQA